MKIAEVISFLESLADPSLQESYDNSGLIIGDRDWICNGIICSLDAIETVVDEAIEKKCNLIVAHHPIIFQGLKKINGRNYVERTLIKAIKNDVAIYAIHTNLDNVIAGVNGKMAQILGLKNLSVLRPKENILKKIYTYVPLESVESVRNALFMAGGGHIGNYTECSFNSDGTGTFKAGEGAKPYVGQRDERHYEKETRVEMIIPAFLEQNVIASLKEVHPYEEPAYEVITLSNVHPGTGSGLFGELPEAIGEESFLQNIKGAFGLKIIRHTPLLKRLVKRVAICGGAGSFLIPKALSLGVDAFITADLKYHEFFDADNRLLLADIGHFESEQFTINLLQELLLQKFLNFAVLKTGMITNPVNYF